MLGWWGQGGRTGERASESHAGAPRVLPRPLPCLASGTSSPPRCPPIHCELVQSLATQHSLCLLLRAHCSLRARPPHTPCPPCGMQWAAGRLTCVTDLLKAEQTEDAVVQLHLLAVALVHLVEDLHQLVARLGGVGTGSLMHRQLMEGTVPRAADALVFALGHPGEEASTVVMGCAPREVALPSSPPKSGPCPGPTPTNYALKDIFTVCQPPGRSPCACERLREKEHRRAVNPRATYILCLATVATDHGLGPNAALPHVRLTGLSTRG